LENEARVPDAGADGAAHAGAHAGADGDSNTYPDAGADGCADPDSDGRAVRVRDGCLRN
jgi:hypothetical protein